MPLSRGHRTGLLSGESDKCDSRGDASETDQRAEVMQAGARTLQIHGNMEVQTNVGELDDAIGRSEGPMKCFGYALLAAETRSPAVRQSTRGR